MRSLILVFVIQAGFLGCGGSKPPCTLNRQAGSLVATADARLNPDDAGNPLPTRVRIFQLASRESLAEASFEEMWGDAKAALGPALLEDSEFTIYPSSKEVRDLVLNDQAHFLAVVALVRRPTGDEWLSIVDLRGTPRECPVKRRRVRDAIQLDPRLEIRVREYRVETKLHEVREDGANRGCDEHEDCTSGDEG